MRPKNVGEFFLELQKEANYTSIDSVKPIYYAILRAILGNLRRHGRFRLPDWGEFRVVVHKARRSRDPNNPGEFIFLPAIKTIKFFPCDRFREYVKNLPRNEFSDKL